MRETTSRRVQRPMRSDARANRGRLLAAARDVFVEQGPAAPLEEISRRAGTGIATLYRRFPDRESLIRAVVLDALEQTVREAHRAADEEPEPFDALVRYMHAALDIRAAAVIPALLEAIPFDDEELSRARSRGSRQLQYLIDAAHRAGTLRPDVTFGDIGLLVVRLCRPLPGGFSRELNDSLAHRHLELLVDGLRVRGGPERDLAGPAMSLDDLHRLPAGRPTTAETELP